MHKNKHQAQSILLFENRDAVLIITLNRPDKLNALNNDLISAIINVLDAAELNQAIRAIVITGAGRAFSAGADIAEFQLHVQAGVTEAVVHFMRPGHHMTTASSCASFIASSSTSDRDTTRLIKPRRAASTASNV
jgi:enoyl-CoA hydratase/carnithine racemase